MFKLNLLALPVIACATGHANLAANGPEPTEAVAITRTPIDPQLHSVDRIANRVRDVLGSPALAEVDVCVRPSGKISVVELVGGSALPAFDLAVVDDVSTWEFPALPGPDTIQSCHLATIQYLYP